MRERLALFQQVRAALSEVPGGGGDDSVDINNSAVDGALSSRTTAVAMDVVATALADLEVVQAGGTNVAESCRASIEAAATIGWCNVTTIASREAAANAATHMEALT